MIELIAALVRSYQQATGKHPDRIVCSTVTMREIMKTADDEIFDTMSTLELDDVMVLAMYGLQVFPNPNMQPGMIVVCRAEDESDQWVRRK